MLQHVVWPLAVRAQQGDRVRRIGVLMPAAPDDRDAQNRVASFLTELRQLGWTEGRNVHVDYRWGVGNPDVIRKNAAELVALARDVILANGSAAQA